MLNIVNGHAGTGKSAKLIDDVYALIDNQGLSAQQLLILAPGQQEKERLISFSQNYEKALCPDILTFDELFVQLFRRLQSNFDKKILPEFLAVNIIGNICKKDFVTNSKLHALTESKVFFKELYNIFEMLKINYIKSEQFAMILEDGGLFNPKCDDKNRLKLIFNVYQEYNAMLKKHGYVSAADAETSVIAQLKTNYNLLLSIKPGLKAVFADNFHEVTRIQADFLEIISRSTYLYIYTNEIISDLNVFKPANEAAQQRFINLDTSKRSPQILQRAVCLLQKFKLPGVNQKLEPSDGIKYAMFEDIQAEISYIANEIAAKVSEENCKYSDFAIIIRDFDSKQKFVDFFESLGIPLNSPSRNEEFQNFKLKLIRYLNICNIAKKLEIESFAPDNPKIAGSNLPKSKIEEYSDEFDLYIENLFSDCLEDNFAKNGFLALKEQHNHTSLLQTIQENIQILSDGDKRRVELEFSCLTQIYQLYCENKIEEIVVCAAKNQNTAPESPEFNTLLAKLLSKINSLNYVYKTMFGAVIDFDTLNELINQVYESNSGINNCVNLINMNKTSGQEYKYVYIPCLSENNFPKKSTRVNFITPDSNEKLSRAFRKINPDYAYFIDPNEIDVCNDAVLLYKAMTRASKELMLSTHRYEDKKNTAPSAFFKYLTEIDSENYFEPLQESYFEEGNFLENEAQEPLSEAVIKENDILKLSPTSIRNFLDCPRKYYYKDLLGLKEEGKTNANYGVLVHKLFELANRAQETDCLRTRLLSLSKILFNAKNNPQEAVQAGFEEYITDLVRATDDLNLVQMQTYFENALEDANEKGFFKEMPECVYPEMSFEFSLEELKNVVFQGRIDALIQKDGKYSITDYKTGKKTSDEKPLEKYFTQKGVTLTKSSQSKYPYQIPLYYLACQNSPELNRFKDKISELKLEHFRPVTKNGYECDSVDCQNAQEFKDEIIQNLKTTVVERIRGKDFFGTTANSRNCKNCSFDFICDIEEEEDKNDD